MNSCPRDSFIASKFQNNPNSLSYFMQSVATPLYNEQFHTLIRHQDSRNPRRVFP
jgi:hypothetical protein